jgi:hypothetical protein
MSEQINMKECARCGELKPLSEFNRHYDGYQPYCRICQMEYNRERAKKLVSSDEILQAYELNACVVKRQGDKLTMFINDWEVTEQDLSDLQKLMDYAKGKKAS